MKIIDNDTFPSNRFHDEINAGFVETISPMPLMIEYVKFNLHNNAVVSRCSIHEVVKLRALQLRETAHKSLTRVMCTD